MSDDDMPRPGRFGPPIGWLRHEVANFVRSRLREATGAAAMEPLPVPEFPEIIREKECEAMTGLGRVHRWKLEQRGLFPKRVRLLDVPPPDKSETDKAA